MDNDKYIETLSLKMSDNLGNVTELVRTLAEEEPLYDVVSCFKDFLRGCGYGDEYIDKCIKIDVDEM